MVLLHEKFSGHPTHGVEGVVGVGMGGALNQTGDQYKKIGQMISLNFVSFIKETDSTQKVVTFSDDNVFDIYFMFFTCKEKVSELVTIHSHNLLLLALHQQALSSFAL